MLGLRIVLASSTGRTREMRMVVWDADREEGGSGASRSYSGPDELGMVREQTEEADASRRR